MVASAEVKQTSTKKNYLDLILFDGTDKMNAKVWNWSSPSIPAAGNIIQVVGKTSTWANKIQLTIDDFRDCPTHNALDFQEKAKFDVDMYKEQLEILTNQIESDIMRTLVKKVIADVYPDYVTKPAAKGIHHAYLSGLLQHSVDVTRTAVAISNLYNADRDLIIAGGLLHDIGKINTYESNNGNVEMTFAGQIMDHIALGLVMLSGYADNTNYGAVSAVSHIIASHHGKKEWGSPVEPVMREAYIIHMADMINSTMNTLDDANAKAQGNQTDKIYNLGNRAFYTDNFISSLY